MPLLALTSLAPAAKGDKTVSATSSKPLAPRRTESNRLSVLGEGACATIKSFFIGKRLLFFLFPTGDQDLIACDSSSRARSSCGSRPAEYSSSCGTTTVG